MDKISLLKELNKTTIKKSDLEANLDNALKESGIEFDDYEDDMGDDDLEGEMSATDDIDNTKEFEYNTEELPIDEDDLQDLASWCEEECGDLPDEEMESLLRAELEELEDFEDVEIDQIVDRIMSMTGRGSDEEDIEGEIELNFDAETSAPKEETY